MNRRRQAAGLVNKIFPARKWIISVPSSTQEQERSRVSAAVCGTPVWFESADRGLSPAAEAWASAMLIPALHQQQRIAFCAPLDRRWLRNHQELLPIFSEWWKYPARSPLRRPRGIDRITEGSEFGLLFTCGTDSFHSLLTHDGPIDSLIYVHGYDVPLKNVKRANMVESHIRRVAAEYGRRVILVRSNLREHPCFREVNWIRTFGGALAAVGHVLSRTLHTLLISPSQNDSNPAPNGSHPHTDPLWGTAGLQIRYLSPSTTRLDRLLAIADSPLVQQYLRVCWQNVGDDLNCSKCEKCLRTMAGLEIAGTLSRCWSFRGHAQLADRIRELPPLEVTGPEIIYWINMFNHGLNPKLRHAVNDLLQRSGYFESERSRRAA